MSYSSESVLRPKTTLNRLRDIVELLGYEAVDDGLRVPKRVGNFLWFEKRDYRSWAGVGLDIYKTSAGRITVTTRSVAARSYWDLVHQNRTITTLRDLFGGHFTTDEGRNRCMRPGTGPPTPGQSGCFMARWRLHNALIRAKIYLSTRGLNVPYAAPEPTGWDLLDELNPRLLSNNLVLPYLIAIWEDFHKSCFAALLRYSARRKAVLKGARLAYDRLEEVAAGLVSVEDAVAESFGFQKPSAIAEAYRLLDPEFDYPATLSKPFRRQRVSLFDSITSLVDTRHRFVHTGVTDSQLSDRRLNASIADFEEAADRVYTRIAERGGWEPLRDF